MVNESILEMYKSAATVSFWVLVVSLLGWIWEAYLPKDYWFKMILSFIVLYCVFGSLYVVGEGK